MLKARLRSHRATIGIGLGIARRLRAPAANIVLLASGVAADS